MRSHNKDWYVVEEKERTKESLNLFDLYPTIIIGREKFYRKIRRKTLEYFYQFNYHYGRRDEEVKKMGFLSYNDYLQSYLWKSIREKILNRDNYLCQCCKKEQATEVHHKSYLHEVLLGEKTISLISLCDKCHKKAEHDDSGKKIRSVHKVNHHLKLLKRGTL